MFRLHYNQVNYKSSQRTNKKEINRKKLMNNYPNNTIEQLHQFGHLTTEECELLFVDKSDWDSEDKHFNDAKSFWEIFSKIKDKLSTSNIREEIKLSPRDSLYNFTYIKFPDMDSSPIYEEYIYPDYENDGHDYEEDTDFSNCVFYGKANFKGVTFSNEVKFSYTLFKGEADFSEITFEADTYFNHVTFQDTVSFENSESEGVFDFSDVAFSLLLLDKSHLPKASYLRLDGWNKDSYEDIARERLSAKHFQTKETARIIKAHFEKQNNIIESNIYYPIEMDKYRDELSYYSNPFMAFFTNQNYFVATLSKYISNYGTSWFRAVIVIMIFSFLASLIFSFICPVDISSNLHDTNHFGNFNPNIQLYHGAFLFFWSGMYLLNLFSDSEILYRLNYKYKIFLFVFYSLLIIGASISFFLFYLNGNKFNPYYLMNTHNYIARIVNPFGAFKAKDIFMNFEAFGTIVRLIMITLMYQFLVSFRQNTRRK